MGAQVVDGEILEVSAETSAAQPLDGAVGAEVVGVVSEGRPALSKESLSLRFFFNSFASSMMAPPKNGGTNSRIDQPEIFAKKMMTAAAMKMAISGGIKYSLMN